MKNRFVFPVVMATVGTCLLVVAAFAGGAANAAPAAKVKAEARGGTLRISSTSDFDFADPSLAYFSHSWQMMNATHLKLLGYPDLEGVAGQRLRAEGAAGLPTISADGLTYTIKIRPGFKFSDGTAVTAENYAFSLNRGLNPKMQSPAQSFLEDVAGAADVISGKAAKASGIVVKDKETLVVKLTKVAPDFLARLTMNFFPAMKTDTPVNPDGIGAPVVSAGPYYLKEWTPKRSAVALRNPYWNNKKEPWKSLARPANVDTVVWTVGSSPAAIKLQIDKNEIDLGDIPQTAASELVQKYGLNKERFFIRKNVVFWYLAMNNEQPLFKGNTKLRQAVNWAIDRPQLVRQRGYLGGARTDQILPPGMPGYKNWAIYPLEGVNAASTAKAKSLAAGNERGGKAVFYTFNVSHGITVAQVVQFNLKQIGLDVEVKQFERTVQHAKAATRGEPFDITYEGWGMDYPDPSNFINVLLDGSRLQAENNVNESYYNDPVFNKRMEEASRLAGDARLKAYGILDRDIMRDGAPMAPFINTLDRRYISESTGCYNFSPVAGTPNLVVLCKK